MVDTCFKCKGKFKEIDLQLSHDVPRWMGGIDKDGRHYLCFDCHVKYENIILEKCCSLIGEKFIPEERIEWMRELSKHKYLHEKFKQIAIKIKEDFYGLQ